MFLTGLSTALHRHCHVCWHLSGLHLAFRGIIFFFTCNAGQRAMGYGLWAMGSWITNFLLSAALTQRTERGSFNARLPVSAGQETPDDLAISELLFAFARKSACLVTCCTVLPHSSPHSSCPIIPPRTYPPSSYSCLSDCSALVHAVMYPFACWRPTLGAKHMNTVSRCQDPAQTRGSNWLYSYRYGWTQTSVRRDRCIYKV